MTKSKILSLRVFLFCLFLTIAGVTAVAQTPPSTNSRASQLSNQDELVRRKNKLQKTSRLFTILTIGFVTGSVVTDERDVRSAKSLAIGGIASASLALLTAIKANKLDKRLRETQQSGTN